MKKAQAANETVMIIAFMTLFLILFLSVASDKLLSVQDDRTKALAEDLADVIATELSLAANAQNGYARTFSLPQDIDGKSYELVLYNTTQTNAKFTELKVIMQLSGGNYQATRILSENIQGALNIRKNSVSKEAGIVNVTGEPFREEEGKPTG